MPGTRGPNSPAAGAFPGAQSGGHWNPRRAATARSFLQNPGTAVRLRSIPPGEANAVSGNPQGPGRHPEMHGGAGLRASVGEEADATGRVVCGLRFPGHQVALAPGGDQP